MRKQSESCQTAVVVEVGVEEGGFEAPEGVVGEVEPGDLGAEDGEAEERREEVETPVSLCHRLSRDLSGPHSHRRCRLLRKESSLTCPSEPGFKHGISTCPLSRSRRAAPPKARFTQLQRFWLVILRLTTRRDWSKTVDFSSTLRSCAPTKN